MRITSGIARGISLETPRGDSTRPATDAARQAIFSSLGEVVEGASALDLFAGTGSYGLEAASRGATDVTFVENDRKAFSVLKKNIEAVQKAIIAGGGKSTFSAMPVDCAKVGKILGGKKFDFIFADPPYAMLLDKKTLSPILASLCAIASPETAVVLEAPANFELPDETFDGNFAFEEIKRLGKKSKGKPSQIIFRIKKK